MNARSHDEYRENIGSYVLGALPDLEAELLERHLATCESCRAEVEELQPVMAAIARSVPQVEPPPSLKAGLMEAVNAEAATRSDERPRERRSFGSWLTGLQPRMAAAMAVGVLVLGIAVGVAVDQIASSGGGSTTTIVAKIDRRALPTGDATLVVKGDNGRLELTGAPQPPAGREYQLWYQHGKTIERGDTFRPNSDGSYETDVRVGDDTDAVMVTVERAGGVPAPTGPPVMQFTV